MVNEANKINMTQTLTKWERVATTTKWGSYVSAIEEKAILMAQSMFTQPGQALEVGCEGGRWSKMLSDLGWQMTCTDIKETHIEACQARIPAANCFVVSPDDEELPCENNSIKLLLLIEVPPVIQSDWFIDEANRVLTDDGVIVGVFWNKSSFRGYYSHRKAVAANEFDFYSLDYRPWREKLVNNRFSFKHEEGFCWFPFSRSSNSVFVPLCVWIEKTLRLNKILRFSPWIVFIAQKQANNI